jgi:hypothetical protein
VALLLYVKVDLVTSPPAVKFTGRAPDELTDIAGGACFNGTWVEIERYNLDLAAFAADPAAYSRLATLTSIERPFEIR